MHPDSESPLNPSSIPPRESHCEESLTDVMDRLARQTFERSVMRRHAAVPYKLVVESFRLTVTKSR